MSPRSLDISTYLDKFIDKKNFQNYPSSIAGRRRDVVGLA